MKKRDKGLTRRDFLRDASAATLVGVAAACDGNSKKPAAPSGGPEEAPPAGEQAAAAPPEAAPPAPVIDAAPAEPEKPAGAPAGGKAARVVLVRDDGVLRKGRKEVPEVLARMTDQGVTALLDEPDPAKAWARLYRPDDVVAVKSNQWRFVRTPIALEKILRERLEGVGVSPKDIAIADRSLRKNKVFKRCTALLNVRPMRTHHWSGVGSLIKNYVNLHPAPWDWHDDSCADLGGLWKLPYLEGKTRLNILVMLTPLFHGKGPHHYHAKYTWKYNGMLFGTDPVAVDAIGLRILEAKREQHFGKSKPFAVPPKHIRVAEEKYALGVADPEKIELIRLGSDKDILI